MLLNTPGTAGGPGGRDRTLAVKSKKIARKSPLFLGEKNYLKKIFFFCIYLLVMPKYLGKQIFTHGRFPEVGQKQKTEEKERERERERERLNNGENNGQATHGARKPPGPIFFSKGGTESCPQRVTKYF